MSVFIFEDFYLNGSPSVVEFSSNNQNDVVSFNVERIPVMFAILNKTTENLVSNKQILQNAKFKTSNKYFDRFGNFLSKDEKIDLLNLTSCLNNSLDEINDKNIDINFMNRNYRCLTGNGIQEVKLISTKLQSINSYSKSEIVIEIECKNCSDTLMNDIMFSIIILTDYLDFQDVYSPLKKKVFSKNFPITFNTSLHTEIVLTQGFIQTDIGVLKKSIETVSFLKAKSSSFLLYQNSGNRPGLVSKIVIVQDSIQENYYRHYSKLPMLFAQIGGFYYMIYVVANNLNMVYSVVQFYLTIDNNAKVSYYLQKVCSVSHY
jgi:hypothetical protein